MDQYKLESSIAAYMEEWMLMGKNGEECVIYPGAGKFSGQYPKDYDLKGEDENE